MSGHTEGPWEISSRYGSTTITGPNKRSIGTTGGYSSNLEDSLAVLLENEANAARIVACVNACEGLADPSVVPELVKAVAVLRDMDFSDCGDPALYNAACVRVRAALAKAKGETA